MCLCHTLQLHKPKALMSLLFLGFENESNGSIRIHPHKSHVVAWPYYIAVLQCSSMFSLTASSLCVQVGGISISDSTSLCANLYSVYFLWLPASSSTAHWVNLTFAF